MIVEAGLDVGFKRTVNPDIQHLQCGCASCDNELGPGSQISQTVNDWSQQMDLQSV